MSDEEEPMATEQPPEKSVPSKRKSQSRTSAGRARQKSDKEESSDDEELDYNDEDIGDIYIPPPPAPPKYSGEQTGHRLLITQIENINFKSYAGRRILGPFQKSFTSIVGPNGSGKSNVIDAMLFVFGYRAQKLRLKKLSALIHKSDQHPNCQSCEVRVHFAILDDKGGDDYNLVEGSQFVVSRTAYKDNTSAYFINKRRVQFKDVSQLLQSHGIDLRYNRFLILQGEVEQIALMKAKAENENDTGMLEFLEDIIGTTRLKAPLVKLLEHVEQHNDLRQEKMNRTRIVQKEKEALERPRTEALEFLKSQNEFARKKSTFLQLQKSEAAEAFDDVRKDYERAKNIYDKAMEKVNEVIKERETKETEAREYSKNFDEHCKKVEEYKESFHAMERKDMDNREKIKHTKTKGKKLLSEKEKEEQNLVRVRKIPGELEADLNTAREKHAALEEDKVAVDAKLNEALQSLNTSTAKLQEEKEPFEKELLELQSSLTKARSAKEIAQSEFEIYVSRERAEKDKLQQLLSRKETAEKELKDCKHQIELLEKKIPENEEQLSAFTGELQQLEQSKQEIGERHRTNLARLNECRNTINSSQQRNKKLKMIMDAKKKGTLSGIFGRLGDLGAIDKKYDIAVSTGCGNLDNIVVDTIENAQKLINFIKQQGLDKTTVIALDKLRISDSEMDNAPKNSENLPRLFDLIQIPDERLRPAFYSGCYDTLVAKDLTQAIQVKGRWRIVTLDGKIVDPSGAMTGGGRPRSGLMGTSVQVSTASSERELAELEEKVRESQDCLDAINEKVNKLHRDRDQAEKDKAIMVDRLPKLKLEVSAKDQAVEQLTSQIDSQKQAVKEAAANPKEATALEKKAQSLLQAYDKEYAKTSAIEEKIEEINLKIKEVMDKSVGGVKKKVEKLKSELKATETEIARLTAASKNAQRNIEKSEDKLKNIEKEIEESAQLLEKLRADNKALETEAAEVTAKYEEANNQKDEMEEQLRKLHSAMKKLQAQETQLNSDNVDAKHEVDKHEKALREREAELKHFDDEIATLELQEIDGEAAEPLPVFSKEQLDELDLRTIKREMDDLENQLKNSKPNMSAIAEYKKKDALYMERFKELEEVTKQRDVFKMQFDELKQQRLKEFKEGFTIITRKLKEMYRTITAGGDAELEWGDSLDPFSEGINFSVRPNKKSWKRISNLSGGEKTLSSLALIFALHYYKPSPLYVMDEIDAALDFKNVSIVANYIKDRTRNTQFIIISLRNNMYELADRLIGIYKTFNCTKCVVLNNLEAMVQRQQQQGKPASNNKENEPTGSQPSAKTQWQPLSQRAAFSQPPTATSTQIPSSASQPTPAATR